MARAEASEGKVRILYPESLTPVVQHNLAPAFEKSTGNRLVGRHAPSAKLTSRFRDDPGAMDVLITADPQQNLEMMASSDGGIAWYASFLWSPLVVGYDRSSDFAANLKSQPWYHVATASGFRLGLTDPRKDARGRLTAKALHQVVNNRKKQAEKVSANSQMVPAGELVQRLKSGQLDAAFLYECEAAAAEGIGSVPVGLGPIGATYTVTIPNGAPHPERAADFVAFLLGDKGQEILKQASGLKPMPSAAVFGNVLSVPSRLRSLVRAP